MTDHHSSLVMLVLLLLFALIHSGLSLIHI